MTSIIGSTVTGGAHSFREVFLEREHGVVERASALASGSLGIEVQSATSNCTVLGESMDLPEPLK